jgi:hypothetical protein
MILLPLALLLCACHNRAAPPAPTAEQSDQLNDSEDMLNALAANENGPEANASGPSK